MPYIHYTQKVKVKPHLEYNAVTAGELNYQITELINAYLFSKGENYQTMNDIMGALTGAQAEFYRRVVAPYEDMKIEENGDVY